MQHNDGMSTGPRQASVEWLAPPEQWLEKAAVALKSAVEECCSDAPPGLEHDPVVVRVCCFRESEIFRDDTMRNTWTISDSCRQHLVCKPAVHCVSAEPILATKFGKWLEMKGLYMVVTISVAVCYSALVLTEIFWKNKSVNCRLAVTSSILVTQLSAVFLALQRSSYSIWKLCKRSLETKLMIILVIAYEIMLRAEKLARLFKREQLHVLIMLFEVANTAGNIFIESFIVTSDALLFPIGTN